MTYIELKTREDVITHAAVIFETAPFLVDLVLALNDKDRVVVVSWGDGKRKIEWPMGKPGNAGRGKVSLFQKERLDASTP